MKNERILLLGLAAALGLGCFAILLPFIPAMLWAAILVFCAWPVYVKLTRALYPAIAAFGLTVLVACIVLLPLVHLGMIAARELRQSQGWVHEAMLNGLPEAPPGLLRVPLIGSLLTDFWNSSADDLGGAGGDLQPLLATAAHSGLRLLVALTHGLVGIIVALFIAYFFFLSGARIVVRLRQLAVRIMDEARVDHLLGLIAVTVRGVVLGILGTSAMQGVLYGIGFELAGAPQALLLASFAGLVSIIPLGAMVIYVPLCLYLLAKGRVLVGIILVFYCFIVIGGADSIIRPWLISRGASLPYVVTLIGVLGGAISFGALGIFLGPVLLTLGLAVAEEFAGAPRGAWRRP